MAYYDDKRIIPMDLITQTLKNHKENASSIGLYAVVDIDGQLTSGNERVKIDPETGKVVMDTSANNYVKAHLSSPPAFFIQCSANESIAYASGVKRGALVMAVSSEVPTIIQSFSNDTKLLKITFAFLKGQEKDKKIQMSIVSDQCKLSYFELHPVFNEFCYIEFMSYGKNTIRTFDDGVTAAQFTASAVADASK